MAEYRIPGVRRRPERVGSVGKVVMRRAAAVGVVAAPPDVYHVARHGRGARPLGSHGVPVLDIETVTAERAVRMREAVVKAAAVRLAKYAGPPNDQPVPSTSRVT